MAISAKSSGGLTGLMRKLVAEGLLSELDASKHQEASEKEGQHVIRYLVANKLVAGDKIANIAANEFGVPLIDLDAIEFDPAVTGLIKESLAKKYNALPLYKRGKRLYIGLSDPGNMQSLDEVKFATGLSTEAVVVEEEKLAKAIERVFSESSGLEGMAAEDFEDLDDLEISNTDKEDEKDLEVNETPVVRFINKCLLDAIKKGASDLHFEPFEKFYRVRFRIDGILQEMANPPIKLSMKLASRIKVMARLDVSERRVPQDGRIKLKLSKTKAIDFRVNSCPTLFGEKICMRILDSDSSALQIDQLGYEDAQKKAFLTNLQKPYGMFLVTGPTGSGKTVSLYSGINILNKVDVNISTAEDPVEINLPGVNQVQVDERTGMTFEKALKAFLRQDPDIILVGEIRDFSTASIAVKAAQTGHMVMSTLHTNDAPQTLTRLMDMGVQTFAVATSINLITGQRLCRRLNQETKIKLEVPDQILQEEGFPDDLIKQGITLYGPGESTDDNPAYKGRAGIYQVMPISEDIKRLIIEESNAVQLADQAKAEGLWDIRRSGIQKVIDGVTSLAEINRVTVE